jgi:hypothetical protein
VRHREEVNHVRFAIVSDMDAKPRTLMALNGCFVVPTSAMTTIPAIDAVVAWQEKEPSLW